MRLFPVMPPDIVCGTRQFDIASECIGTAETDVVTECDGVGIGGSSILVSSVLPFLPRTSIAANGVHFHQQGGSTITTPSTAHTGNGCGYAISCDHFAPALEQRVQLGKPAFIELTVESLRELTKVVKGVTGIPTEQRVMLLDQCERAMEITHDHSELSPT